MTDHLPDLLTTGLRVVFCGTAASTKSAELGQYYAGPGNRFWQTLHEIGLTTRRLGPAEYECVLAYRIGLTDIAKTASGADVDIPDGAYDGAALRRKIQELRPGALAFNGKNAAIRFLGESVEHGRQEDVGVTAVFVLPSTSGAARRYWDIDRWKELAAFVGFT